MLCSKAGVLGCMKGSPVNWVPAFPMLSSQPGGEINQLHPSPAAVADLWWCTVSCGTESHNKHFLLSLSLVKYCVIATKQNGSTQRESGQKSPLAKKLFAMSNYRERENQFSPTECPWGCQPHAEIDPRLRSSWLTQNGLHVFACAFVLFRCFDFKDCLLFFWER